MRNKHFGRKTSCLLPALVIAALTACDTPEPTTPDTQNQWRFGLSSMPVDPPTALGQGGQLMLTVESPEDWTIASSEEWLSVQPASGKAGLTTVTVTTQPNTDTEDRLAVLTLSAGDKQLVDTFYQYLNIFKRSIYKTADLTNYFTVNYKSGVVFSRLFIVVPFPESNPYQEIRNLSYGDAKVGENRADVKYLYYYAVNNNVLPSGSRFIDVNYTVDMYYVETDFEAITHPELPYDTKSSSYKRYTNVCKGKGDNNTYFNMINPKHPWVEEKADQLWEQSGQNRIEYARLCYECVASEFTYGIYDGDNSVEEIIERMSGDCGNQHAVWLSLMRNKGIPARPIVMNSPENFTHVRGEFYMPGYGWIPVDVTYHQSGRDYFGKFTKDNLVVMNNDFGFQLSPDSQQNYYCNLLQVVYWLLWGNMKDGEVDGYCHFGYAH